jgi:DNA-binding CsgD family transcriptional regulator
MMLANDSMSRSPSRLVRLEEGKTYMLERPTSSLSCDDAAAVAMFVADIYTSTPHYAGRLTRLLEGLVTLCDAKVITAGLMRPTATPDGTSHTIEVIEGNHIARLSDEEQSAMHRYFADILANPDPAHAAMCGLMMTSDQPALAGRHQDLVDAKGKAWTTHRDRVRTPGGVGAEFFLACKTSSKGVWGALALHRDARKPDFSPRDLAVGYAVVASMVPLFDGRLRELAASEALQSLSQRMRDTLGGLLAGGSEKTIAMELGLSRHTVHEHVKRLHRAFNVSSRGELLSACQAAGITTETARAQTVQPLLMGASAERALRKTDAPSAKQKSKASRSARTTR